jgi:hypothetical protein
MEPKRAKRRPSERGRVRQLSLATAARRRLDDVPRPRGRVWINGREIGAHDSRFDHLSRSHD